MFPPGGCSNRGVRGLGNQLEGVKIRIFTGNFAESTLNALKYRQINDARLDFLDQTGNLDRF